MNFKFLLSDLDGVIRKYPQSRDQAIEEKFGLPKGSIYSAAFKNSFLEEAVCGRISDELWRSEVRKKLSVQCSENIAEQAVNEWSDFPGQVDYGYLHHVERYFPNIPIAVLTNGTSRLNTDLKKLGLENRFFKIFNSAEIGVCKPAHKIYLHVLEVLGCQADEILFVDDSASHIQGAHELGFKTHHYESLEQFVAQFQKQSHKRSKQEF